VVADPILEDGGVRTARDIAHVLVVPVRQQHQQNLQAVQLVRFDEWILVPRPAVLVEVAVQKTIKTSLDADIAMR